jgi:hypothetical protein
VSPPPLSAPLWRSRGFSLPPLLGGRKKKAPKEEAVDLTAYRRHALDLLQGLHDQRTKSAKERLTELGYLGVVLGALVEDLKSVGAAAETVRPLEELLNKVRAFLSQGRTDGQVLDQVWSEAEAVLQAFGTPGKAAGKRREGFWK